MPEWEYRVTPIGHPELDEPVHLEDMLSNNGSVCWELIGIFDFVGMEFSPFAVFKRLVDENCNDEQT